MRRFLLIFISVIGVASIYIGVRLVERPWQWAVLAASVFFVILMPVVQLHPLAERYPRTRVLLRQIIYFSMGFINALFVVTVLRDLAALAIWSFRGGAPALEWERLSRGTPGFAVALLFVLVGAWRALRGPRVREVPVAIEGLPAPLKDLRIAQISDLHIGPTIGASYVERVVEMVARMNPDLTVLTGDIIDGDLSELREVAAKLKRLPPAGRVFFVPGNHEYYWRFPEWVAEVRRWDIQVLLNEGTMVEWRGHKVWVGGVTDPAGAQIGSGEAPDAARAASGGEAADLKILLSHRPHLVEDAARAGFDLQLSGHTHGGQFFPWTYFVRFAHTYFLGLMRFERTWVYVSPGTGSWGPPLRLGTTPEVTHIHVSG